MTKKHENCAIHSGMPSIQDEQLDEKREWTPLELAEVKTPRRIGPIWRQKGASSRGRIKPDSGAATYHVISFSNGVAIGRRGFVEKFAVKYRDSFKRQRMRVPKKVNIKGSDTEICVLKE